MDKNVQPYASSTAHVRIEVQSSTIVLSYYLSTNLFVY